MLLNERIYYETAVFERIDSSGTMSTWKLEFSDDGDGLWNPVVAKRI
mgnify:CR=1 FL=1